MIHKIKPQVHKYAVDICLWVGRIIPNDYLHQACDRSTGTPCCRSDGWTEIEEMGSPDAHPSMGGYKIQVNFGQAVEALKLGSRVVCDGWNGKGMFLELQQPDSMSKMTLPYIYMSTVQGDLVPWLASQTDILSEDWSIILDA